MKKGKAKHLHQNNNKQRSTPRSGGVRQLIKQELASQQRELARQQSTHCSDYCKTIVDPHNAEAMVPVFDSEHLKNVQEAGTIHLRKTLLVQSWASSTGESQFDFIFDAAQMAYDDTLPICYSSADRTTGGPNFMGLGGSLSATNIKASKAAFPSPFTAAGSASGDLHFMPVCASVRFVPTTQVLTRNGAWVGGPAPEDDAVGSSSRLFDQLADFKFAETADGRDAFAVTWMAGQGIDHSYTVAGNTTLVPAKANIFAAWRGNVGTPAMTWICTVDAIMYVWGAKSGATERVLRIPNLFACVAMAYGDNSNNMVVSGENIQREVQREKGKFLKSAKKEMARIVSGIAEEVNFSNLARVGAKLLL